MTTLTDKIREALERQRDGRRWTLHYDANGYVSVSGDHNKTLPCEDIEVCRAGADSRIEIILELVEALEKYQAFPIKAIQSIDFGEINMSEPEQADFVRSALMELLMTPADKALADLKRKLGVKDE